jgi:hypothetical protein
MEQKKEADGQSAIGAKNGRDFPAAGAAYAMRSIHDSGAGRVSVADQVAERRVIEPVQDINQLFALVNARCERSAVGSPQRRNMRVPVLARDLAIPIAMAFIKAWLVH